MNNKIDYNNLKYVAINSGKTYEFSGMKDSLTFLDGIKKGIISLEEAKYNQQIFLENSNTIRKGNKNAEQKRTLAKINIFF